MSILDIKQALVDTIVTVPGIGQVHNRLRRLPRTPTHADVRHAFGIDDPTSERQWSIRTWMWYRRGRPAQRETLDNTVYTLTHHLILQGYWEINDAYDSETEWNMACDAITKAFQPHEGVPLTLVAHAWSLPALVTEADATLVGLYECHDAELHMDVVELVNNSAEASSFDLYAAPWNLSER